MSDLKFAYDALAKDATIWDEAAASLQKASQAAGAIEIYRGAFSFAGLDVADEYAALHAKVMDLLRDGSTEAGRIAQTLRTVRDDFQRVEDLATSEFHSMWKPVEY